MLSPILILKAIALIIAITIHEFSHAFAADRLGDPTPRANGRLSLNPLAHLDPLGTIALIVIGFGWGKAVTIDPYNLSHPRRDEFLIAAIGPISNLAQAIIASLVLHLTLPGVIFSTFLYLYIQINLVLAIFNLIPIWPLDGSKILLNLLPFEQSIKLEGFLSQYGTYILLAALFLPVGNSNLIAIIMSPPLQILSQLLLPY